MYSRQGERWQFYQHNIFLFSLPFHILSFWSCYGWFVTVFLHSNWLLMLRLTIKWHCLFLKRRHWTFSTCPTCNKLQLTAQKRNLFSEKQVCTFLIISFQLRFNLRKFIVSNKKFPENGTVYLNFAAQIRKKKPEIMTECSVQQTRVWSKARCVWINYSTVVVTFLINKLRKRFTANTGKKWHKTHRWSQKCKIILRLPVDGHYFTFAKIILHLPSKKIILRL